ncbi:5-methylcytosine-specific restriction endonuclease system specificity protein McrC [Pseudidiomarina sp. E22-M8]|uniref:5-methylcytosine-specific restriction endonuclease system specificity protein McrC n=1 Tax=Pseudidiomarina sp. E22-M8 TaxID=3424768 RepID=UPI00403D4DB7
MASSIPIQNIYYLLCYAWNKLPEGEVIDVTKLDSTELVDLFATVLIGGVNHVLRRGLDRGYELHNDELSSLRGRIDIAVSARKKLIAHGRAQCEFDEFTANTLPNRIIKTTLRLLTNFGTLDADLRRRLRSLYRDLHEIDDIQLNKFVFRKVQLNFNNRYYAFLLSICELVQSLSFIDETTGDFKFKDFLREEKQMASLYEAFLLNFFKSEFPRLAPKSEQIRWLASSDSDPTLSLLPTMRTDISLSSKSQKLIIDAKYYKQTLSSFYDKQSLHSANLYQLLSYIDSYSAHNKRYGVEGMLIYPVVTNEVNERYVINGKRVYIRTVNLAADWTTIRASLREIAEPLQ